MTFRPKKSRRSVGIVFALAALLFAGFAMTSRATAEVYADDPNSQDPNRALILALAKDLAPIADAFGCKFAWGQISDASSATLEFVPKGDDVRKWTRLVTITTLGMPPQEPAQAQLMARLQNITLANFTQRGRVLQSKTGDNPKGMPALYFEYELGDGAAKEHGAVGVYKTRPKMGAIVQIQSRGKPLARDDAAKMRALAIPQN
jgi:hypothetical protein